MSKYTTEVRFICENYAGYNESQGQGKIADIIANSRNKVFDFDYPIFDEAYRSVLETKILKHFYLREICAETVGVWKHFLDMRLNEIMPYYNKLYESELIDFNPMYDTDYARDYNKDTTGTGTVTDELHGKNHDFTEFHQTKEDHSLGGGTLNSKTIKSGNFEVKGGKFERGTDTHAKAGHDDDERMNTRWDIYSDTPQGGLSAVDDETYLTNARKIVDNSKGSKLTYNSSDTETKNLDTNTTEKTTYNNVTDQTNEGTTNHDDRTITDATATTDDKTNDSMNTNTRNLQDIEDYLEHVKGKTGSTSFSKLLQEFRETFLNIDLMIINDLNDLFFGLW